MQRDKSGLLPFYHLMHHHEIRAGEATKRASAALLALTCTSNSIPMPVPSIMATSQSIAVPSRGFAGRPSEGVVMQCLYWPKPLSKPRTNGLLLHEEIDFSSNRRSWSGSCSENGWKFDSSCGLLLLLDVFDLNYSSETLSSESGFLHWIGPN